jgi:voltage-gated potassium channel
MKLIDKLRSKIEERWRTMQKSAWRNQLHEIINEADTPMGKAFDLILLILILLSVLLVMLESVVHIDVNFHTHLYVGEWIITIFFTFEYIARIITVNKPSKYIFSFYGIIDFLSTIPLYLSLVLAGSSYLLTVRALRLLRIFRILKITRYIGASNQLVKSLLLSRAKILVFLLFVLIISVITGTLMYLIEGEKSGFTSIPTSVYWAIVTLTTVGYGDISPATPVGQFLASFIMILGYGIIAVPTGIVSAEYSRSRSKEDDYVHVNTQVCINCGAARHRDDAAFCHKCGTSLEVEEDETSG